MAQLEDEFMISSISANPQEFKKIVERYSPMIYNYAFRLLCNEEDAKDILQETFIKAWKNLQQYNARFSISTWLYTIATNCCRDAIRKQKRQLFIATEINVNTVDALIEINPEKQYSNKELGELILAVSKNLTPKQNIVFTLTELEQCTVAEIEAITGLGAAKIKSNLYLARKNMKEQLKTLGVYEGI